MKESYTCARGKSSLLAWINDLIVSFKTTIRASQIWMAPLTFDNGRASALVKRVDAGIMTIGQENQFVVAAAKRDSFVFAH